MPYTPSAAAQALAVQAAANQAALAAPLTAMQTSIAGGNLAPAAFMDAIVSGASSFQGESNNTLSANSTTSGVFADVPGSSITFTALVGKLYTVHCDFAFAQSAGTLVSNQVRLVVNGSNGPTIFALFGVVNSHGSIHLMHAAPCAVGANTIKVQWAAGSGATLATTTSSYANYIVSA